VFYQTGMINQYVNHTEDKIITVYCTVRNIFIWYAEKKITETEVRNAIEFLTEQGILKKSFYD